MEFVKPINRDDWGDPDPANKIPGAVPPAKAFSQTMTEMVNVITSAGLTPSGEDLTQFDQAIKALVQKKVDEANMLAVSNTVYQRNIGDFIFTNNKMRGTKATGSLNGAYECNGDEFSETDFEGESTPYQLLVAGNLPSVTYAKYAEILKKYGNCGYYALDTAAKKFKIPTIKTAFLQAGTPGEFKEAGIPNIAGEITFVQRAYSTSDPIHGTGALDASTPYTDQILFRAGGGWGGFGNWKLKFNASKSSAVYGKSSTVQPPAVCTRVMVQLANEIDNATSLEKYLDQIKEAQKTALNTITQTAQSEKTAAVEAINTAETEALNAMESRETEALGKLAAKESEVLAKFETEQNDLKTYVEIAVEPKYDAFETAIATSEEKIQALTAQNTTADGNIAELTEQNELAAENIEALTNLNNTAASTVQTVTEKAAAAAASAEAAENAKTAAETAVNGFDAHVAEKKAEAQTAVAEAEQEAETAFDAHAATKQQEVDASAAEAVEAAEKAKQYRDEAQEIANLPNATEETRGMARIATTAEVEAGTNDESFVTPAKLKPVVSPLAKTADLTAHTGNKSNPHGVTKAQVGLGNVDNTADANKPVSTAQKSYVDNFQPAITTLTAASGTLTLAVNKVYSAAITGNTTFSLPTPGNKNVFNQIKVMLKVTGTPTINWGTTQFFNKATPEIEAGCYDVYFDYDNNLSAWVCGAMPKGAAA